MKPEAWKRRIGKDNFEWLAKALLQADEQAVQSRLDGNVYEDDHEQMTAAVLTQLYEIGWRGPEKAPKLSAEGTRTLWPSADGSHMVPVLTSKGLEQFWRAKGHGWLLLRMPQACRAMAGPLAPRFQEMLAAYEEQCAADSLPTLPAWADWDVFVGGELSAIDGHLFCQKLANLPST